MHQKEILDGQNRAKDSEGFVFQPVAAVGRGLRRGKAERDVIAMEIVVVQRDLHGLLPVDAVAALHHGEIVGVVDDLNIVDASGEIQGEADGEILPYRRHQRHVARLFPDIAEPGAVGLDGVRLGDVDAGELLQRPVKSGKFVARNGLLSARRCAGLCFLGGWPDL